MTNHGHAGVRRALALGLAVTPPVEAPVAFAEVRHTVPTQSGAVEVVVTDTAGTTEVSASPSPGDVPITSSLPEQLSGEVAVTEDGAVVVAPAAANTAAVVQETTDGVRVLAVGPLQADDPGRK